MNTAWQQLQEHDEMQQWRELQMNLNFAEDCIKETRGIEEAERWRDEMSILLGYRRPPTLVPNKRKPF